ncbi:MULTISPECIES: hypothetical protein [unclassified Proteiniphilum]|uniref:hypothetical protein n=1 Tax=unclassified Proteiniphilum TaxID=2622718 RepID=UPI00257D6EF2|nr:MULTISPECIES: hypothetical protein [unclassified Proteiniphilum]
MKQPVSFSRVSNMVSSTRAEVGKTTIINYIGYVKDTWLISSLQNIAGKLVDKETKRS